MTMTVSRRILLAELWLLAMAVHLDGWNAERMERAELLLKASRRVVFP